MEEPTITLQVFEPITGKGIDKKHTSNTKGEKDESDYIHIGLIVREFGNPVKDKTVVIECNKDEEQNVTLEGTGNIQKMGEKPNRTPVPYYPFTYYFKKTGMHRIKFTCDGEEVTIKLQADKKPKK